MKPRHRKGIRSALASIALLAAFAPQAAADPAAPLFDPANVTDIRLTAPQSSLDAFAQAQPSQPGDYQPATFTLTTGGTTYGPLQVGLRPKGSVGSFRPLTGKMAWKVKFNEFVSGQRLLGLKKLTLNNMVQDPSMVHELLTYELARANGVAAPRTGYAFVRLNNQAYGLYLNVETLDDVSLPQWFGSTRHLYEGAAGSDVTGPSAAFDVDEGSETNRSDLDALRTAVTGTDGTFSARVGALADLGQMARMWAVERYVGHFDGYSGFPWEGKPNNYYLHSDTSGRFRMLPSGTDRTWDLRMRFGEPGAGALWTLCVEDPQCYVRYRDAVAQVRTTALGLDLDGLAERTATLLRPWQRLDTRKETSLTQIDEAVAKTRSYVGARPQETAEWLANPVIEAVAVAPSAASAPQTARKACRKAKGRKARRSKRRACRRRG